MITQEELLKAIPHFEHNITALVAKGSYTNNPPDEYLPQWIFESDVHYGVFEVVQKTDTFTTPYVTVIGYRMMWMNN